MNPENDPQDTQQDAPTQDHQDGAQTRPEGQETAPDPTLDEITAERDQLAAQLLRLRVANDLGVPAELLHGDDEEQLRTNAAALLRFAETRRPADFGAGNRGSVPTGPDNDPIRRILGR